MRIAVTLNYYTTGVIARRVKIESTVVQLTAGSLPTLFPFERETSEIFFYIRSTFSITNFRKPKTLNLPRQIIRPKWRTAMVSQFGSGLILKISLGEAAQKNADMAAGIQARSWFPVRIAAGGLAWCGNNLNSLNTNWTLFTSKTQENFVTVRLPMKKRKLAKFDLLYNTKTFSRKTGLSSLKRAIESSRNISNKQENFVTVRLPTKETGLRI